MPKRMLIDASHQEETRVVILDGNKVEEFDFEAASKRPLKGNIYLAKVTRVEPSLQAAFVEYGGNRQGFLAFSEIHPDYYQIPVADRLALLADQSRRLMAEDDDGFEPVKTAKPSGKKAESEGESGEASSENENEETEEEEEEAEDDGSEFPREIENNTGEESDENRSRHTSSDDDGHAAHDHDHDHSHDHDHDHADHHEHNESAEAHEHTHAETVGENTEQNTEHHAVKAEATGAPVPHQRREPRQRPPRRRQYKIQEVIKRRQVMLIQVVKEERGNKGASLTTFLSLAGRYCVLMPNTPRGGGISRKITSATDRRRLKSAAQSLELPEGMGLIIRTAGANRTKVEIKRDYEYLLRLWDSVRELTLKSNAPALVYEEGNLVKRVIRDLYNKDISEVLVDGEGGYRDAKDFMRMLMPSHAKNVKLYKEVVPLYQRFGVEAQLDAMFSPTVTLRSGGYIVINQTEALVAIDVNSGKATREHNIEDTAYKTNCEAADEIGRQLRLRDLAGLIVIDFIDMEDGKNDRNVEKRLRDAVRGDRARVQIGKISQFGLMEMSRQRLRAGVVAGSTVTCPHCAGLGLVRSTESAALRLLRSLEEEGQRQGGANFSVRAPEDIVIFALNQKRREIARIEESYDLSIIFEPKPGMAGGTFEIERTGIRASAPAPRSAAISMDGGFQRAEPVEIVREIVVEEEEAIPTEAVEAEAPTVHQTPGQQVPTGDGKRKRRRRRRGGRGREHGQQDSNFAGPAKENSSFAASEPAENDDGEDDDAELPSETGSETSEAPRQSQPGPQSEEEGARRRRRRRRGRRGRRRDGDNPRVELGQEGSAPATAETHSELGGETRVQGTGPIAEQANDVTVVETPQWSPPEPLPAYTSHVVPEPPAPVAIRDERSVAEDVAAESGRGAEVQDLRRPEPPAAAPEPTERKGGWWQRRFKG